MLNKKYPFKDGEYLRVGYSFLYNPALDEMIFDSKLPHNILAFTIKDRKINKESVVIDEDFVNVDLVVVNIYGLILLRLPDARTWVKGNQKVLAFWESSIRHIRIIKKCLGS